MAEDTPGDSAVLKTLQAAAKGLLFPSESDKPVKAFVWQGTGTDKSAAVDEAALKAAGKVPDGAKVETRTLDAFFEPVTAEQSWWGDTEKEQAKRYNDLAAALKELSGLTVLRVIPDGSTTVDAYVVGRTNDGDLAGVTTQLIET